MGDSKRIPCDEGVWHNLKDIKQSEDVTWNTLLNMLLKSYDGAETKSNVDPESVASEITAKLNVDADEAQSELDELHKTVQSIQNHVQDLDTPTVELDSSTRVSLDAAERVKIAREVAEELR